MSFISEGRTSDSPYIEMIWNGPYFDAEMGNYIDEQFNNLGAILLGRVTYQMFAGYWPTQGVKDAPEFAARMNSTPKLVFSRTLEHVNDWSNSRLIKDNIVEEIQALKQQDNKNMVIDGSSGLIHSFTNLGLIDEYRIRLHPVVLGAGLPLFKDIKSTLNLKLVDTKIFPSGVVILHYQPVK